MNSPLITIGIPTYNRADGTLMQALESALDQTYPNLEVIVSDNCSTDDTPRLLGSIADPRFRYVRHDQNLGANGNFNACVDAARGEYFLLLHDDDLIDPDFVEVCVRAIAESGPTGLVQTGVRIIDGDGATLQSIRNQSHATDLRELVVDWFEGRTSFYFCNTLINTGVLRTVGGLGSRHNLFQDVLAYVKITAGHGCTQVPGVKASFRRHDSNMGSAAQLKNWCEDSQEILETIEQLIPDQKLQEQGRRFLCRMNYSYVADSNSFLQRLSGYRLVSRHFGASESALRYAYVNDLRPRLRALKRRLIGNEPSTSDSRAG